MMNINNYEHTNLISNYHHLDNLHNGFLSFLIFFSLTVLPLTFLVVPSCPPHSWFLDLIQVIQISCFSPTFKVALRSENTACYACSVSFTDKFPSHPSIQATLGGTRPQELALVLSRCAYQLYLSSCNRDSNQPLQTKRHS